MSTPPELPTEPPPLPDVPTLALAADPSPVIGYAGNDTTNFVPQGTRVALGILAGVYLLFGFPSILGIFGSTVQTLVTGSRSPEPGVIFLQLIGAAIGGVYVACGFWMIFRKRWMWRALHITLAICCALELIAAGCGAAMAIAYKHATSWDAIVLGLGVFLFALASVPFLLHAFTKLALLRLNFRRAFQMGDYEPHTLHRVGTIVMLSLYAAMIVICGTWFALV